MLLKVRHFLVFCLFCSQLSCAWAVNLYLTEVAPFAFSKDGKGNYDGINVRIVNELVKRSGVPIELIIVPSARHVTMFPSDREAYSISQIDNFSDRDGSVLFEVTQYPILAVAQRGAVLKTYEDLISLSADRGIGVMRRLSYGGFGQDERVKKVEISTLENGLRMLEIGRISGIVGSQPAIMAAAEKNASSHLLGPSIIIAYGTHVMRVRPDFASSPTSKVLTTTLAAMKSDGSISRILDDFTKTPRPALPQVK